MSFNVGASALRTNQAALQVIGHNIANVNTPGFSRQNVMLEQIPGQKLGNGYFGRGVGVAAIERSYSQLLTREANLSAAAAESANTRFQRLQALEQLFPMGEAGMGRQLNAFLNAWADVIASPTNQTARQVVLTRADEMALRLNKTAAQLDELSGSTKVQLETSIDQINRLSSGIAALNQRVVDAFAGGLSPNDLLDQRDRLIADLNKLIEVRTLEADDRSLTVFAGNSVPIVLGNQATRLVGSETINPEGRYTIGFGSAAAVINEGLLAGGSLKGLLTFYNDDVADVRKQLGRLALSTVELTNRQHRAGLDLNGQPGGNFFNPIDLTHALVKLTPASPAALELSLAPHAQAPTRLQASDYLVRYQGADQVQIQRLSDGAYLDAGGQFSSASPVTLSFPPSPPAPASFLEFDGLRLTQTASGMAGDQIVLKPMTGIADQVKLALTSPAQLAVASPVLVTAGANNSSSLQVESLFRPATATAPAGWTGTTLAFVAGGYSVDGGPPQSFVSGQPIEVHGFSLTLRGQPQVGDTFLVRPPQPGESTRQNVGNGQALLALRDVMVQDGYTLSDGYIPVFAAVSSRILIAKSDSEFATRLATQAEAARANQAGVNLDEEAARLLQFQQAYQASARYLQSMQTIFDTLLSTFR